METDERWIPADPEYRSGLYKQISEVPPHHRLKNYASRFKGRDTWHEYITATGIMSGDVSANHRQRVERTERRWKSYMDQRGVHHALCSPSDASDYAEYLFDEFEISQTVAARYWGELERFYRWMLEHTEYPHRYNSFVIAAINDETARDLWCTIINR